MDWLHQGHESAFSMQSQRLHESPLQDLGDCAVAHGAVHDFCIVGIGGWFVAVCAAGWDEQEDTVVVEEEGEEG